uniref:Uncharacterized protein n=1 Tax=Rhizophora mucronata TaxID=61149 RepID=A0A2P2QYJ6_RHIMU
MSFEPGLSLLELLSPSAGEHASTRNDTNLQTAQGTKANGQLLGRAACGPPPQFCYQEG